MAEYFKTSTIWVVGFRYEGQPRRWFKAFGPQDDVRQRMIIALRDRYGERAQLVGVRKAPAEEELQYLRGEEPKNVSRPAATARFSPRSRPAGSAHLRCRNGDLREVFLHAPLAEPRIAQFLLRNRRHAPVVAAVRRLDQAASKTVRRFPGP